MGAMCSLNLSNRGVADGTLRSKIRGPLQDEGFSQIAAENIWNVGFVEGGEAETFTAYVFQIYFER